MDKINLEELREFGFFPYNFPRKKGQQVTLRKIIGELKEFSHTVEYYLEFKKAYMGSQLTTPQMDILFNILEESIKYQWKLLADECLRRIKERK